MASVLNFGCETSFFLCFEYPIVINTTTRIITIGCSTAFNRSKESFITVLIPLLEIAFIPSGETKYKMSPIKSCKCVTIKANRDILKSLGPYSLLEKNPISALSVAKVTTRTTK